MGRDADFSGLIQFAKNWEAAYKDFDAFLKRFLLQQAQRAMAGIKKRTPVDTGALQNVWRVSDVRASGDVLEVLISNGMDYASFVEYGHRNWKSNRWHEGRFMMTISIAEVERAMEPRFRREFADYLRSKGAV